MHSPDGAARVVSSIRMAVAVMACLAVFAAGGAGSAVAEKKAAAASVSGGRRKLRREVAAVEINPQGGALLEQENGAASALGDTILADAAADPRTRILADKEEEEEIVNKDCSWLEWSSWSSCSLSCGTGIMLRLRGNVPPSGAGARCDGMDRESKNCNWEVCPIDCMLGSWDPWEPCSVSCGGPKNPGKRQRTRKQIALAAHGGKQCSETAWEVSQCSHKTHETCPTDCTWSAWSEFNRCSLTCGQHGGLRLRQRTVLTQAFHSGKDCLGAAYETEVCNKGECAIDCEFYEWSEWGECTRACGMGEKNRLRDMRTKQNDRGVCFGSGIETVACLVKECPIDCAFTEWGDWSGCSAECGGGEEFKRRNIYPEKHGGKPCVKGDDIWTGICAMEQCT